MNMIRWQQLCNSGGHSSNQPPPGDKTRRRSNIISSLIPIICPWISRICHKTMKMWSIWSCFFFLVCGFCVEPHREAVWPLPVKWPFRVKRRKQRVWRVIGSFKSGLINKKESSSRRRTFCSVRSDWHQHTHTHVFAFIKAVYTSCSQTVVRIPLVVLVLPPVVHKGIRFFCVVCVCVLGVIYDTVCL